MLRKITKIVFALAGTVLALSLVIGISLAMWVMSGPRSLTKLMPYIEASLNPEGSAFRVDLDDALVYWQGWSQPIDLRLQGVAIHSLAEQTELVKLNEVSVGLDMPSLLRLKLVPETLILRNPQMRFFQSDNGTYYVGIENANQRVPLAVLLAGLDSGSNGNDALAGHIRFLAIQNAHLSLGEPGEQTLLDAQDADLRIHREDGVILAELDITMEYDARPAHISGRMRIADQKEMVVAKVELLDISPHMFSRLAPQLPELATLRLPLSGWADVAVDNAGNITLIDYMLQNNGGQFSNEAHFAEPLDISSALFEGQIRDNFHQFVLKKGEVHFGDTSLNANGIARLHEQGWAYDAVAVAENMPVNELYKYWPKSIGEKAYDWVTSRIREGTVPHAEARLKRTVEQLAEPLPDSALEATIEVRGAQVEYLPEHPKLEAVDGQVNFTANSMTINARSGKMLEGTALKEAWLHVPQFRGTIPQMQVKLSASAPAADVARYLSIPKLNFAKPLGLDPQTIGGQASGDMQFQFLIARQPDGTYDPQLTFKIEADVTDGVQPGFLGDKNLTAANGALLITQDELNYKGSMALSNAPLTVDLTHYFKPREDYQTVYHASGVLAIPQLTIFGLPEMPFLMGDAGINAQIKRQNTLHNIRASVDLGQVAANIPEIGLSKQPGSKAQLDFEADTAPGGIALKAFKLTGDEVRASGSATVVDNLSRLQSLRFDNLEFGDNNLAVTVEAQGDGYKIRSKGASLDLKPLFDEEEVASAAPAEPEDEQSKLPFPVDFHGEFDWIVIGKERELRKVNAQFVCTPALCESADMRGVTGQSNEFVYQIKRIDGVRELNFVAQDAGSFLRAMDIFDNMTGGTLTVRGRFDDRTASAPFSGQLNISEHTISNAPVLAKIASLLSLSGIGDALQGKGISFRRLSSAIGYANGTIRLSEGKAYGPALGITVEDGVVDTKTKQIAVSGTVVPSYTLNTVLDNIPVIGEALSGGKGEGVFAATYKVKGTYPDNTQVSVNPLSMLAPGFLRNVFGAGANKVSVPEPEQPAKASENVEQPAPQTEAMPAPSADAEPAQAAPLAPPAPAMTAAPIAE